MMWSTRSLRRALLLLSLVTLGTAPAKAGGPFARRGKHQPTWTLTPTAYPVVPAQAAVHTNGANANAPSPMLGSFYPTPYMTVRGNWPTGGGYSPLGVYGTAELDIDGPLSSLRPSSAPVLMYTRGYNGVLYPTQGTALSYPNLPPASRVIYPTQGTPYYGLRESGTPPWWNKATNWIDQN
jgi:hypothetical protein